MTIVESFIVPAGLNGNQIEAAINAKIAAHPAPEQYQSLIMQAYGTGILVVITFIQP